MSEDRYKGVTVWFDCDITQFKNNPLMFDTPFGKPVTMARGNIFEERDELEAIVEMRGLPTLDEMRAIVLGDEVFHATDSEPWSEVAIVPSPHKD